MVPFSHPLAPAAYGDDGLLFSFSTSSARSAASASRNRTKLSSSFTASRKVSRFSLIVLKPNACAQARAFRTSPAAHCWKAILFVPGHRHNHDNGRSEFRHGNELPNDGTTARYLRLFISDNDATETHCPMTDRHFRITHHLMRTLIGLVLLPGQLLQI